MKKVFLILSILIFSAALFAQNENQTIDADFNKLSLKSLELANEAFEKGDFDGAYRKINMAIDFADNAEENKALLIIARTIYKKQFELSLENEDQIKLLELQKNIHKYPFLFTDDIDLLIQQCQKKSEIKTEEINRDLVKQNTESIRKLILLVIIAVTIMLVVIFAVLILVQIAMAKSRKQQEVYIQAIQNLAENQNRANQLLLGGMTDLYGGKPFVQIGSGSVWQPALAVSDVDISEVDQEQLKELAIKCEEIGEKIDLYTDRKNNSKNVSELVYKLSIALGVPKGMAMLNFCAAMVYDAGFLGMDSELLKSTNLTEDQKEAMKNHVVLAEKYIDFVPKKYWSVFEDAVMKHHENIDGSGYPNRLSGEEIPQIARLIHVAESYVSLSSRRTYRETLDKETAIEILKNKPQYYDKTVVEALDSIV